MQKPARTYSEIRVEMDKLERQMEIWSKILVVAVIFWVASIILNLYVNAPKAPVRPVAAPQAPIGYFCGDYPKIAPAASVTQAQWHTGRASFYGEAWRGRRTASGTRFSPDAMTCAHKSLPFGTRLEVRHGQRSVIVTVSDRGPYVPSDPRRVLDLSEAAFAALAPVSRGVLEVSWRKL